MAILSITNDFTPGTVADATQVNANNTSIETWANGNVSDDNFSSSAGVYTAYRSLTRGTMVFPGGVSANTFPLAEFNGGSIAAAGASTDDIPNLLYLDDADWAITGRTPKLRVRAQCFVNGTPPGNTLTVGLHEITASGGTGNGTVAYTLGAAISGSTVAFSPLANSRNQGNSGDFTFPADSYYTLAAVTVGSTAANTGTHIIAQLQLRWT